MLKLKSHLYESRVGALYTLRFEVTINTSFISWIHIEKIVAAETVQKYRRSLCQHCAQLRMCVTRTRLGASINGK